MYGRKLVKKDRHRNAAGESYRKPAWMNCARRRSATTVAARLWDSLGPLKLYFT